MSVCVCAASQVHIWICNTWSAQLHSLHYPLWTRADIIAFSVSPIISSPLFFPPSVPLLHHLSLLSFLTFLPASCPIFVACFLPLSRSIPLLDITPLFFSLTVLNMLSTLSFTACGLISVACVVCCWVTEPTHYAWFWWVRGRKWWCCVGVVENVTI